MSAAIDALDVRQLCTHREAQVIVLTLGLDHFRARSVQEIALALKISASAVRAYYKSGLARLYMNEPMELFEGKIAKGITRTAHERFRLAGAAYRLERPLFP